MVKRLGSTLPKGSSINGTFAKGGFMIAILNYQAGNLKSLLNALSRHGVQAEVTSDADLLLSAELVILPGVGAFADAAGALETSGLGAVLNERHLSGKPILGICLGMQLFYEDSSEGVMTKGLGFMQGQIRKLSPNNAALKVPHMGWNLLESADFTSETETESNSIKVLANQLCATEVYFVHSYGLVGENPSQVLFYADHGQRIPALVYQAALTAPKRGALIGFQFHPEKSGPLGEQMLITTIKNEVNLP
jgi:glutamine amidotransferase